MVWHPLLPQQSAEIPPASTSTKLEIRRGPLTGHYYLAQPAPTQWVAVATVSAGDRPGAHRLVVGSESSEAAALERRLVALTQSELAA